jgi:murein L,D-transpeptidase YcbB/YkuD
LVLSAAIAALVAAAPEGSTVAQKAAKKPPAAKPATKTVAKAKAPAKAVQKSGAPKAASAKAGSKRSTPRTPSAPKTASQAATIRRTSQVHPTPERYKEIQQALADKHYFSGSVDGNWGQDSVDALKRFQHDQNLTEDGKIGSLSLIALGLGPKHDASPIGSAPVLDKPSEKPDP